MGLAGASTGGALSGKTLAGCVVVISSPGRAYARMEAAWLASWRRQHIPGVGLLLLQGRPHTQALEPLSAPQAWCMTAPVAEGLIPGVLDKTGFALRWLLENHAGAWMFRTNLSSHVDVGGLLHVMQRKAGARAFGFSPGRDHLSGAGMGLTAAAVVDLSRVWATLDRSLIDDVAISGGLFAAGCEIEWTGRLDRVWPDGLVEHGRRPHYHVRVKTRDRDEDASVLQTLAESGIQVAEAWFNITRTPTGFPVVSLLPPPL